MPVVLAFVDLRQVLTNAGDLLLERDDTRLHLVEREMRHDFRDLIGQTTELLADIGEELSRDDQTDVLIDDCN